MRFDNWWFGTCTQNYWQHTRMQLIKDNADIDATPIIRGEQTIQEIGEALYDEILAVAAGKLTKSEIYGHYEV